MGFHDTRRSACPECGYTNPPGNLYCGKCGFRLTRAQSASTHGPEIESTQSSVVRYPVYQRQFSMLQRFAKLVTSPREAMADIGRAPDYGGVIVLFVLWIILSTIGVIIMTSKMEFTGTYSYEVTSGVMAGVTIVLFLAPIITFARWLVKSFMVRYACESKNWNYETAASVTGYAYLPNVILSFFWIFVIIAIVPPVVVDTTNLEQALVQLQMYDAQTAWITIGLNLIGSVLVLLWKSYLGGIGAHAGTRESCSESTGTMWFLVIGFIGLLIDIWGVT